MSGWTVTLLVALAGCGVLDGFKADKNDTEDDDDDDGMSGSAPLALAIVWDNSPSMVDEAAAIALALPALDASRGDRELRLVVTTPSVHYTGGATDGVDPGEAGLTVAAARTSDQPGWMLDLTRDLLCDTVYWSASEVPSDPSYECDAAEPSLPSVVSAEYLDCLCGFAAWEENFAGSGDEEPLEATLMLGCRASAEPPESCFDALSPFLDTSDLIVTDWPGEDVAAAHVLVVTDEGDNSRRLAQGDESATAYLDAYAGLPVPPTISAVALTLDPSTGGTMCSGTTVPTWSLDRLLDATGSTGGGYWPIAVDDGAGGCVVPDLAPALTEWIQTR